MIVNPQENTLDEFIHDVKLSFGANYRKLSKLHSGRIWQNRFWDHIIRDEKDMNHHINYIHYNPVKHGYVNSPFEWEFSSLHQYKNKKYYQPDWGAVNNYQGDYGE